MRQKAGELAASFISRMGWDVPFYSDPRWVAVEAAALAVCLLPNNSQFQEAMNSVEQYLPPKSEDFERALAGAVALVLWSDQQEKLMTAPGLYADNS